MSRVERARRDLAVRKFLGWRFTPGAWKRMSAQQRQAWVDWAIAKALGPGEAS